MEAYTPEEVASTHNVHWSYSGRTGPQHWGELSPEYALCATGRSQSPIDIPTENTMLNTLLGEVQFNYQSTPATVINNSHTIQINYEPGSTMTYNGQTYDLVQFHFHNPSEHTIGGERFPLEAHLVHRNDQGDYAVVGVMLKEGAENAFLNQFWNRWAHGQGTVQLPISVNVAELLPSAPQYYTYEGSLTTPPCSQSVRWIVMREPVELSTGQIASYAQILGDTARPLQPLNGRPVQEYPLPISRQ